MRNRAYIAACVAAGWGLGFASVGHADPLDPALSRLVILPACHDPEGGRLGEINDDQDARQQIADAYAAMGLPRRDGLCAPDERAFKRLVNEWGFALAPASMYGARTTGFGGFHVSLQGTYSKIHDDQDYWKLGTQGERDASSGAAAEFGNPPGILSVYGLNIRKNFGLGVEALANVGFVPDSSIINGGADIRVSLLEGFRKGVGSVVPDMAVGGGIRTITGTDQLQLTTVALDARISKPFVIADSSILTPVVGYQYVWIFGRSGVVDLTPATDPLGYCGYAGQNIPREGATAGEDFDGQAVCYGGTSLDFNNNVVFDQVNLERQRILFGLQYRYEFLNAGAQFMTDLMDPADAQTSDADERDLQDCDANGDNCKSVPGQWQLAIELGVSF